MLTSQLIGKYCNLPYSKMVEMGSKCLFRWLGSKCAVVKVSLGLKCLWGQIRYGQWIGLLLLYTRVDLPKTSWELVSYVSLNIILEIKGVQNLKKAPCGLRWTWVSPWWQKALKHDSRLFTPQYLHMVLSGPKEQYLSWSAVQSGVWK